MSASESNKLRNLPIALLHLLLNTPIYGAVGARPARNPAPTQELVGKPTLALFNWPAFLLLLKVKKPSDAPLDWCALTCEPNPFTHPPFVINDSACTTLAAGISHLQENCPSASGLKVDLDPGS